ncbi:MAG: hypothetical protein K8W52_08340 [Deltaproteobacteria bacterium]|nr:hypothetical protein [Deltaproteobacteria bacterium]
MKKLNPPAPRSSESITQLGLLVGGNSSAVGNGLVLDPTEGLMGTQIGNPGSSGLIDFQSVAHWGVGNG